MCVHEENRGLEEESLLALVFRCLRSEQAPFRSHLKRKIIAEPQPLNAEMLGRTLEVLLEVIPDSYDIDSELLKLIQQAF